jgi:hypothetical protein
VLRIGTNLDLVRRQRFFLEQGRHGPSKCPDASPPPPPPSPRLSFSLPADRDSELLAIVALLSAPELSLSPPLSVLQVVLISAASLFLLQLNSDFFTVEDDDPIDSSSADGLRWSFAVDVVISCCHFILLTRPIVLALSANGALVGIATGVDADISIKSLYYWILRSLFHQHHH